jgi:microcystin-dependent protein
VVSLCSGVFGALFLLELLVRNCGAGGGTFGGDGINTFAVPDLRPKDANGNLLNLQVGEIYEGKVFMETFISLQGIYPTQD